MGLAIIYWARTIGHGRGFSDFLFGPSPNMSINEVAHFAELFVFTVIVVQNLTVLLLTPVYVGSAITEEKERKTLDLLFATQMRDHEIVLGKLLSRIVHLGMILLSGLPVLSMAQLWGGIDFPILAANFLNTGLILLSVGSVSILVSTICRRVMTAIITIYCVVLPVMLCLGIFSMGGRTSVLGLAQSDIGGVRSEMMMVLASLALFHGMIAIACISVALVVMRGQHGSADETVIVRRPARETTINRSKRAHDKSVLVTRAYELPPIHNDPLFWKEINLGTVQPVVRVLFLTLIGLSMAFLLAALLVDSPHFGPGGRQNGDFRNTGVFANTISTAWAFLCCILVAYAAAATVARERQQGTLDALLTLPDSRGVLFTRKWLGCFFRGWLWWICLAAVVGFNIVTGTVQVSGGMLLLAAVFVHGAFFCSVGMYLSIVSPTVLAAQGRMALLLLVLFVATFLFSDLLAPDRWNWYEEFLRVGLNPLRTWWTMGFTWGAYWQETPELKRTIQGTTLGLALYATLAALFSLLAWRRFRRL